MRTETTTQNARSGFVSALASRLAELRGRDVPEGTYNVTLTFSKTFGEQLLKELLHESDG